jgi:sarcosine oxidase, subunit alpha
VTRLPPVRTSAMYRAQQALGARFKEDGGWRVADVYTSTDDEASRARTGIGLSDVSACGKLGVRGDRIESFVVKLTGRSAPAVGLASWERVNGAPVLLCRRADDELLLLTASRDLSVVADVLEKTIEGAGCVHGTDLSAAFAAMDLIGPGVSALLERLIALDLATVPVLGVIQSELARVHAIIVGLNHPTLPAYRALVPREYGDFVWTALGDAGHDLGLTRIGAAAHARLIAWEA